MTDDPLHSENRGNQFAKGFVAALLTLAGLGLGYRAVVWLIEQPQPRALFEVVTMPLLSIADIVWFLLFVVVVYAVLWMAAFGPRGSSI